MIASPNEKKMKEMTAKNDSNSYAEYTSESISNSSVSFEMTPEELS